MPGIIKKHNTLLILIFICFMERAFFRLEYVSADSIIPFFVACLVFVLAKKIDTSAFDKRRSICVLSTAFTFSALTILGSVRALYEGSPLRILFDTACVFVGLFFLFTVFIAHAYDLMESILADQTEYQSSAASKSVKFSAKRLAIYSIICFLGWTPLFLRYYPGSFGADSVNQIRQAMHLVAYDNHLPVLSTWLIELFYRLGFAITGNNKASLACYTVFQMMITAITYAACVMYLELAGLKRRFAQIILAVLAICPLIAMYAIYIHKDTPAADLLLLLIIVLHYFSGTDENKIKLTRKQLIGFTILGILFILFRSNHYYIYFGLIICAFFAYKHSRKVLLAAMIISVIVSAIFKGPVLKSMNITNADACETLSMPLQMVSYTISVNGQISDADLEFIDQMIPHEDLASVYSEISANPVKRIIRDKGNKQYLEDHKVEFMKLFLRVAAKNPIPCLIALTDHSKGYYCPKFTYPELIVGAWENEFDAYTEPLLPEGIGMPVYLFCQISYDLYEKYLGCGMATWLTIFLLFFAVYKRKSFLPYMPSIGIVTTFLLASPNVGRFRYQYPVMTAAIILFGLTFCSYIPFKDGSTDDNSVSDKAPSVR